ncbi:hypothetical protein [Lentzea xinjiangensis]|uniref:hypothetical protein n=1 Tax=Lentzea xinjiangensis TaxID=402600 RepID=UPI000B7E6224|nr:hypothetical protein [Lentzea xinjiangensis]
MPETILGHDGSPRVRHPLPRDPGRLIRAVEDARGSSTYSVLAVSDGMGGEVTWTVPTTG